MINDMLFINESIDLSYEASNYLRDNLTVTYVGGSGFFVGLYKPFKSFYIEVVTPPLANELFSIQINAHTDVKFIDETQGLKRSGFIHIEPPIDWVVSEADGTGVIAYWIRFNKVADFTAVLAGINIVFSDDIELSKELIDVSKFKKTSSFIAYHVAARDEIIQRIRNQGKLKINYAKFEKWDILDIDEIKQAATYLALSKICFNVSNAVDDKYYQMSKDFMDRFAQAFDLFFLTLDFNDDGKASDSEKSSIQFTQVLRL